MKLQERHGMIFHLGTMADYMTYFIMQCNIVLVIPFGLADIHHAMRQVHVFPLLAFRELRLKIKRHLSAIVAAAKYGLSNARVEATNNKIKLLIRTAYGFRNTDSLIAMVMLSCSVKESGLPFHAITSVNTDMFMER